MSAEALKLEMVQTVISLPNNDSLLRDIADYIKSRGVQNGHIEQADDYPSGRDPILDYIGGISHGSLSANIDEELYGALPA